MIYKIEYPKSSMLVDTDKIAKRFVSGESLYVRTFSRRFRVELVEFLEAQGFCIDESTSLNRLDTVDSELPLSIDLKGKRFSRLGNVTSAAAAAGCGIIMSDMDFYLLYSLYVMEQ